MPLLRHTPPFNQQTSSRRPLQPRTRAHAADDASHWDDHRQQRRVRGRLQLVHPLVKGGLPADQRPGAHVVEGGRQSEGQEGGVGNQAPQPHQALPNGSRRRLLRHRHQRAGGRRWRCCRWCCRCGRRRGWRRGCGQAHRCCRCTSAHERLGLAGLRRRCRSCIGAARRLAQLADGRVQVLLVNAVLAERHEGHEAAGVAALPRLLNRQQRQRRHGQAGGPQPEEQRAPGGEGRLDGHARIVVHGIRVDRRHCRVVALMQGRALRRRGQGASGAGSEAQEARATAIPPRHSGRPAVCRVAVPAYPNLLVCLHHPMRILAPSCHAPPCTLHPAACRPGRACV